MKFGSFINYGLSVLIASSTFLGEGCKKEFGLDEERPRNEHEACFLVGVKLPEDLTRYKGYYIAKKDLVDVLAIASLKSGEEPPKSEIVRKVLKDADNNGDRVISRREFRHYRNSFYKRGKR